MQESVWDLIPEYKKKEDLLSNKKYFDLINLLIKNCPFVYEKPLKTIAIDGAKYTFLYSDITSCINFLAEKLLRNSHTIYENISNNKDLLIDKKKEIITTFIKSLSSEQKKQCPLILGDRYSYDQELNKHYVKELCILDKKSIDIAIDHIFFQQLSDIKKMLPFLLQNAIFLNDLKLKKIKLFLLCIHVNKDFKKLLPKPILSIIFDMIIDNNKEKLTLDNLINSYIDKEKTINEKLPKIDYFNPNPEAEKLKKICYSKCKEALKEFFYIK